MTGGYIFTLCVSPHLDVGGVPGPGRGVPNSAMDGGVPGLRFSGGEVPGLRFSGGIPVSIKGKIFGTRFGLIHVQTGEKNFLLNDPPRIAKNCYGYAAGGMPLVFTQEDFLVYLGHCS